MLKLITRSQATASDWAKADITAFNGRGKTDRLTLLIGRFLISLKLKGIIYELN